MDVLTFNLLPPAKQFEYFWDNTDDKSVDSIATKNFDYFLMKDRLSDLHFELRVAKIGGISIKVLTEQGLKRYSVPHNKVEKDPWE